MRPHVLNAPSWARLGIYKRGTTVKEQEARKRAAVANAADLRKALEPRYTLLSRRRRRPVASFFLTRQKPCRYNRINWLVFVPE